MGHDSLKAAAQKAELAIVPDEEIQSEIGSAVAEMCDDVMKFEITDAPDFDWATGQLRQAKRLIKEITEFFEPMRSTAHAAYQAVLDRRRDFLGPLELAEGHLRDIMGEYTQRKELERAAAEKAAREKALKAAEEKRLAAIEEALDRGDEAEADALVEAPVTVKASEVAPVVDEIPAPDEGVSFRSVWHGELVGATQQEANESLRLLCKAISEKQAPVGLVQVNTKVLNALAKNLKDELNYPGVVAVERKTPVVRGG